MDRGHAHRTAGALPHAHRPVRCTRLDNLHPEAQQLVDAARGKRAEAEQHDALARAARAELGATLALLAGRHGVPKRVLARLLGYRSDNSVRVKTSRNG